jgi:MATE family multidrug resistance protein
MGFDTHQARKLLQIAIPLVAAYIAEYAMFVTTKIVVGQLGYYELAAVGISGDLSFEVMVILMGLLSIVGVLCAQAEGAGRKKDAGQSVRQGFILSLLISGPATYMIWNLDSVLIWTGQDPKVIELSIPYIHALSGFVLPVLLFAVLRNFVSALSRPGSVMIITVAAVVLNYLLTIWLVYGGWGVPAMGVRGAGLATNIVSWVMFFFLLGYVFRTKSLRGYGIFISRWKFEPTICMEIIRLGVPVAGLVTLEAGLFVATSILSGVIGATTLAAYEVVMAWVGIPFVVAMGLAEATMVRVAHGIGAGNPVEARRSGIMGMVMGVTVLIVMMVIPLGFAEQLVSIFVPADDAGSLEVSLLAVELLFIAAIFQVFDGMQAIAARALRAVKDNYAPLWIAGIGYWVFGIGGGTFLAFYLDMGGAGLWWGLALGLTVTGLLLAWRFHRLSCRLVH